MNLSHRAVLDELKSNIDKEFGQDVIWISQTGTTDIITGTFSFIERDVNTTSKSKTAGQLHIDVITATFCVSPHHCPCEEGDRLEIDGVSYLILPFQKGEYEIVLPLKITQNKDHNWR